MAGHSSGRSFSPRPEWDLTERDAETEDELQSDSASCMSTDPSEGRVVSVAGADLEQVPTPVIDALQEDLPVSRRHRRLVLVSTPEPVSSHDHVEPTAVDSPADSPSDSGYSASVTEAVPEVFEAAGRFELNRRFLHTGLEYLDSVDLHIVFRTRALVMKSVPFLLKGAFRAALICALREVLTLYLASLRWRRARGSANAPLVQFGAARSIECGGFPFGRGPTPLRILG